MGFAQNNTEEGKVGGGKDKVWSAWGLPGIIKLFYFYVCLKIPHNKNISIKDRQIDQFLPSTPSAHFLRVKPKCLPMWLRPHLPLQASLSSSNTLLLLASEHLRYCELPGTAPLA